MKSCIRCCFLGLATLVACSGCGDDGLAAVKGRVTLNGQPLANARIQFQPLAGKRPSEAVTDASGAYTLLYTIDRAGAEIGIHRIEIRLEAIEKEKGREVVLSDSLPVKYNDETTLEKEVKPGLNQFDFSLTDQD